MIDATNTTVMGGKWWLSSLTIRGALLSAASAALPAVAAAAGIDGVILRELGEATVTLIQAAGGLAGLGVTIAGRLRATEPLTRRDVQVRI